MTFSKMTLPTGETVNTYPEYLSSNYWAQLKDLYIKVFSSYQLQCDCCNSANRTYIELHHASYDNLGTMEAEIFDIILVCRECHETITAHEKRGVERIEAIRAARMERLEEIKRALELMTEKFHFELKRTPVRIKNSEQQKMLDEQIIKYMEAGLLSETFAKKYLRT